MRGERAVQRISEENHRPGHMGKSKPIALCDASTSEEGFNENVSVRTRAKVRLADRTQRHGRPTPHQVDAPAPALRIPDVLSFLAGDVPGDRAARQSRAKDVLKIRQVVPAYIKGGARRLCSH